MEVTEIIKILLLDVLLRFVLGLTEGWLRSELILSVGLLLI
jgi:hypothetical protein